MIEDPSKVPPEEKYPKMTLVDVELIRSYIRKYHQNNPQIDGIWYEHKDGDTNQYSIPYYRLEDEDGYAVLFNSDSYKLEDCIAKFKELKATDPDWNYGKLKRERENVQIQDNKEG